MRKKNSIINREGVTLVVMLVAAAFTSGQKCEQNEELTTCWEDPVTGLCWQDPPRDSTGDGVGLYSATQYCEGLGDGWRVPTIDELRSLVRGCAELETGGACGLNDPNCLVEDECWEDCSQLSYADGDGPGQGGQYQVSELSVNGSGEMISKSLTEPGCDECVDALYLEFRWCEISVSDGFSSVRCVRDEPF